MDLFRVVGETPVPLAALRQAPPPTPPEGTVPVRWSVLLSPASHPPHEEPAP